MSHDFIWPVNPNLSLPSLLLHFKKRISSLFQTRELGVASLSTNLIVMLILVIVSHKLWYTCALENKFSLVPLTLCTTTTLISLLVLWISNQNHLIAQWNLVINCHLLLTRYKLMVLVFPTRSFWTCFFHLVSVSMVVNSIFNTMKLLVASMQ